MRHHISHYLKAPPLWYARGSLSIRIAACLGREIAARPSSRQIFDGLRMGAGCLPSSGVCGIRKDRAGLYAGESTPTRFARGQSHISNV